MQGSEHLLRKALCAEWEQIGASTLDTMGSNENRWGGQSIGIQNKQGKLWNKYEFHFVNGLIYDPFYWHLSLSSFFCILILPISVIFGK